MNRFCATIISRSLLTFLLPVSLANSQDITTLIQHAHFVPSDKTQMIISPEQCGSILNAFVSFDRGSKILLKYKEPEATRGVKGISVFREVSPAVTLVVTGDQQNNVDALGTGVIIDPAGYVLTNWHVVSGHEDAVVFMKPPSGAEVQDKYAYYARVVYANPLPDLALLKLVKAPSSLPSVKLADIAEAQVAEDIHIIGHPHGKLWSYSTGVLSQIRADYEWKYDDGSEHKAKVLQMQTAINPGNSGGPVVDDAGRLIGLVAMSEEGQNLDYAISADVIKTFLTQAMSTRTRGVDHKSDSRNYSIASSALDNGTLYRSEYSDREVYWIATKSGENSTLFIRDKNGAIEASRGAKSTGFTDWTATLSNGDVIHASSTSEFPEMLWASSTPPSK